LSYEASKIAVFEVVGEDVFRKFICLHIS
jgi:hypothetical protein